MKKLFSILIAGMFLASSAFGATKLHKDLTGTDLHVCKVHGATTHIQTGTDPLTNSTAEGMTGQTSYAQGDLLYYTSGTTLSKLAKDTNATRVLTNTGTNNNPAWAQVTLTSGVTGILPIANGGTNASSFANSNGLIYYNGTSLVADTAALTSGRVPYATTNGRLTDSANLTYDGTILQNAGNIRTSAADKFLIARFYATNDDFGCALGYRTGSGGVLQLGNNGVNEIRAGSNSANGYLDIYTNNTAAHTAAASGTLAMRLDISGNIITGGATAAGTSATNTFVCKTGTAPTTSPADSFQLFSKDLGGAAGQAAAHMKGEDGNVVPLGMNLINNAKGRLINDVYSIVAPENIVLFNVFDPTGATTTVVGRNNPAGTQHNLTLSANASTLSPSIAGMCPTLTTAGTETWTAGDSDDFTFTEPQAFTIMLLLKPTNFSETLNWIGKLDLTTGSEQREWEVFTGSNTVYFRMYQNSDGARIGRYVSGAQTAYAGTWQVYSFQYTGVAGSANMGIYRGTTKIDDSDDNSGSYTAMANTTASVANYTKDSTGTIYRKAKAQWGVCLIVKENITDTQRWRLVQILKAYVGDNLN